MKHLILIVLGALAMTGCAHEKGFDVTGAFPSSDMQDSSAPERTSGNSQPATTNASMEAVFQEAPSNSAAPAKSEPAKVTITPDLGLQGKVIRVNSNLRFIVLNFPVGRMPATEQQFAIYRQGQKVGEARITGPQQDDNIIADITKGEAQPGDEVRQN